MGTKVKKVKPVMDGSEFDQYYQLRMEMIGHGGGTHDATEILSRCETQLNGIRTIPEKIQARIYETTRAWGPQFKINFVENQVHIYNTEQPFSEWDMLRRIDAAFIEHGIYIVNWEIFRHIDRLNFMELVVNLKYGDLEW